MPAALPLHCALFFHCDRCACTLSFSLARSLAVCARAAQVFGFGRLGTVYGLLQALGALCNLAIPGVTAFVLEDQGGDWSVVLWAYVWLCPLQFLVVAILPRTRESAPMI